MVRDRIVVGIRDSNLSEKLQMDSKLTLEKAISMARCNESVKQQQTTVRNELTEHQIERIKGSTSKFANTNKRKQFRANSANTCTRCGQTSPHGKTKCPAREAVCHKCKKKGHFKALCKSTVSVNQLNANSKEEQLEEDAFLGASDRQ